MPKMRFMTIERHIIEGEKKHPGATGELSRLLSDLVLAFKVISLEVNKAGLVDILGFAGSQNVHGEEVKKLDMYAHEMLFKAMDHGGHLCIMASEEEEDIIHIPSNYEIGKYVLLFDPLDGSSNIDANVSIGTIFSIYKRVTPTAIRAPWKTACSRDSIRLRRDTLCTAPALSWYIPLTKECTALP